jgi:UDP-GlcNAc:undecaprenyl-phosphate/decaprenyl-phosphate GlcNAc-1-phosphate transferase
MLLALRPMADASGLIDKPGGRKSHQGDIPVVGGMAMFAGLLVAAVGGQGLTHGGISLLTVAGFMVALGVLDDRFNLPPNVRLFAHLSASVALVYGTEFAFHSLGDLVGTGPIKLGVIALPFTVFAVVALINAFNMLDGLDGLAGSAGLVAFGGIMYVSSQAGSESTLLVAGSMFGAVSAFLLFNLPLNFNRAMRTFMGDAGSTLLGFVMAGLALKLAQPQPESVALSPIVVLWMMPMPVFEVFASTVRRLVKGMPPTQADSSHFHHVLINAGISVRAICTLYFVSSVVCCAIGIWAWSNEVPESLLFVGFLLLFAAWLLVVRNAHKVAHLLPEWLRRADPTGH